MKQYTHLIWDYNGTLLDDTWLCLDIMNNQLAKAHKPAISMQKYQEMFDFPVKLFYERIGFDFSKTPYEIIAQEFIKEYSQRRFEAKLHTGVQETLLFLKNKGYSHSILSAYASSALKEMIDHFGLTSLFTHIVGLDNHYAGGKIEEGKTLLALTGISPLSLLLIGDTTHDAEVARALGIQAVLISCGHHTKEKLSSCRFPVIPSLDALIPFLSNLNP